MASEAAADRAAEAAGVWKHAQKVLKVIQKETSSLKRASPSEITDARWKSLEEAMSQYRLACVGIMFQDLEFAEQNQVEKALWTSHILINNIYRQVSKSLPSNMKAKIRNVENQYKRFITTSQLFYKGYIQRLSQRYNIESLHRVASAVEVEHGPSKDTIHSISPDTKSKILRSVQETLTYLGDLARYRSQLRPSDRDNQSAVTYYSLAHDATPDRGNALHQIGVTYLESDKHLDVVYYFFLSLARSTPHPNAQRNLESKLKAAQSNRTTAASSQTTQQILEGRVVQLFANYVTNPSFAGRDELEKTVLARLEQFLQGPHSTEVVVKIALVGMGAYYYAMESQGKSIGSVYALSFTLQILQTICRTIRAGVQEAQGVMPGELETKQSRISAVRDVSSGMDTAVRVLRLFCCWLSTHAENLGQTSQPVQALVEETWKEFAQTITELVTFLESDIENFIVQSGMPSPPTPPYLLEEDEEAICYLAIGNTSSAVYRRLFHKDDDENVRKRTMLESGDSELSADNKLILCLGDIVFSIQHFSDNDIFPITIRFYENREWSVDYGYDLKPEPVPQQAILPDQATAEPAHAVMNGTKHGNTASEPAEEPQSTHDSTTNFQDTKNLVSGHQGNNESAMDSEPPRPELSQKFQPLPWGWFHAPTPTGPWATFTRGRFEGREEAPDQMTSPVVGPAGPGDSQREMLLRMLRSASGSTSQGSGARPAFSLHSQGAFHASQPGFSPVPLSSDHNHGAASNPYQNLMAPYQEMAGEQAGAYMLYPQDQHYQQAYHAQAAQQVEQQMAAMQLASAQAGSRPRSSRRSGGRARNQPDETAGAAGYQKRHVHRGIGGP